MITLKYITQARLCSFQLTEEKHHVRIINKKTWRNGY